MSTTDERVLRTMRVMAWERAKGELRSMTQTYWGGDAGGGYNEMNKEIEDFIARIEDNGIQE